MLNIIRRALFTCGLLALMAGSPALADRALLVGINHYANLPPIIQLHGPDNDVAAMAQVLTRLGFTTTTLTDAQATRQGILDALAHLHTQCRPNERFVFFYAGHGTKTPEGKGALVPSDALFDREDTLLSASALNAALAAVPAASRTALLDSCYSGAMQRVLERSKSLSAGRRARFVDMFHRIKALVVERVNNRLNEETAGDGVCYFAAANGYQQAQEGDIGSKCDGFFTVALVAHLISRQGSWGDLQTAVTADVMARSHDAQTPTLSQGYADAAVFGGAAGPPMTTASTLWNQFNASRTDPAVLSLAMSPDRSAVQIGEQFTFTVTPSRDGYLVVLEMSTEGNLNLIYPATRDADAGRVPAGRDLRLPTNSEWAFTTNTEGAEAVRAMLFLNAGDAQQVLSAFPPSQNDQPPSLLSWRDAAARGTVFLNAAKPSFWTAPIGFEVTPQRSPAIP